MASTEKGAVQSTKCCIEWKIERFFADCEKVGDSYTSPVFTIPYANKISNWVLKVYPKSDKETNKDYISLYLDFKSCNGCEIIGDFQFSIVSEQKACPVNLSRSIIATFKDLVGWGWGKFANRDVITDEKNGFINNDTLTILCEILFLREAEAVARKSKEYNNLLDKIEKELKNYDKLFECNDFSDVTFTIQNQKLYLHKAILSCRNSYFKDMFENEMEEERPRKKLKVANDIVKITNVSYEVMKEVLRFIYTGKVQNIQKSTKHLLIAANEYIVSDLKALCEMTLAKTLDTDLTIDTAIDYLKLVDICATSHLKTSIIEFAVKNGKEIITKPEFQNVDKSVIIQIMQEMVKKV